MTSSTITAVNHNALMDPPHPRANGPRRRRAFTASDKIARLHAYEQACEHGEGGAYLRREGLYSSLISEWRKQRDAGVLGAWVSNTPSGVSCWMPDTRDDGVWLMISMMVGCSR